VNNETLLVDRRRLQIHGDVLPLTLLNREHDWHSRRKIDSVWWSNRGPIDAEESVARLNSGVEGRSIQVDVLKHPPLPGWEQCRPCCPLERHRRFSLMKEVHRRYPKLVKQVLHLQDEVVGLFRSKNAVAPRVDEGVPVASVKPWIW
jgi:hypothetical protein